MAHLFCKITYIYIAIILRPKLFDYYTHTHTYMYMYYEYNQPVHLNIYILYGLIQNYFY